MDETVLNKIFMAMGLSEDDLPSSVIEYFYNSWAEVYPDNECLSIYNTIASLYEWLIKSAAKDASGGGSYKEKVGDVEVTLGGYNKGTDWEDAYDNFLSNPTAALPSCKDVLGRKKGANIMITGTSKSQYHDTACRPDAFNQYDERSPFSTKPNRKRRIIGFRLKH